uniref:Uncharacterized protein n=1 Tax=Megaselia scalaris TaxID=36166 RepID=T1H285_MEGSC
MDLDVDNQEYNEAVSVKDKQFEELEFMRDRNQAWKFYQNPMPNNLYYLVNHTISENENRIRFHEIQVNLTQNRFDHYVETVRHNTEMVERTISEFTSELTLFGFLNETNQNCVVKYARIPDVEAFTNKINICANTASSTFNSYNSVLQVALNNLANAKTYNGNIRWESQVCYNNYIQYNSEKMPSCIQSSIDLRNASIDTALLNVQNELAKALNTYDFVSRDTTECIYKVEFELGKLIDNQWDVLRTCQKIGKVSTFFGGD